MYSVCLTVSKLFLSEYFKAGFSSDGKHEKFAVGGHVLINTQNVVMFCRGQLRNVPSFIMRMQSHYSAN